MTGLVDQAIADVDKLLSWLEIPAQGTIRKYGWSATEDAELSRCFGRMALPEVARRCTTILRQVTGDPRAERTVSAILSRAGQLGLKGCRSEAGELLLKDAARLSGVSVAYFYEATLAGRLATTLRSKRRYVTERDLAIWLVDHRNHQEDRAEVLNAIEAEATLSKREAMALSGLSETQLGRYLQSGVIAAWRLPDLCGGPGAWRVQRASVEAYVRAKAAGRLQEMLDTQPGYVALRADMTIKIRQIRQAGRLPQRDPLTEPKSRFHPGCFTVAQLASHARIPTRVVYEHIRAGYLSAVSTRYQGRTRYAVKPTEAGRYVNWLGHQDQAAVRRLNGPRLQIAKAGLLTVKDLAERWLVSEAVVRGYVRRGLAGHILTSRYWARYLVFDPDDVERFEKATGIKSYKKDV